MDNDEEIQQLNSVVSDCEAVLEMQRTPGWQIIKRSLTEVSDVLKDKIIYCADAAQTVRLQEKYKAFNRILDAVSNYTKLIDVCKQELQDRKDHKDYLNNYGLN